MKVPADKSPENQRQAAAHDAPQQQASAEAKNELVDNREETADLRQLQETADNSPQAQGLAQLSAMMNNSPRSAAMQNLQTMVDNSPRQVAQRVEDEEVLQGKFTAESPVQIAQATQAIQWQALADGHLAQRRHPMLKTSSTPTTLQRRLLDWPNEDYDKGTATKLRICVDGKIDLGQMTVYSHVTDEALKALKEGKGPAKTMGMADADWETVYEGGDASNVDKINVHAGQNILTLKAKGVKGWVKAMNEFNDLYGAMNMSENHILHVSTHNEELGMTHRHSVFYDGKRGFDRGAIQEFLALLRKYGAIPVAEK